MARELARWGLQSDVLDAVGGYHGENREVVFDPKGHAVFDGRGA